MAVKVVARSIFSVDTMTQLAFEAAYPLTDIFVIIVRSDAQYFDVHGNDSKTLTAILAIGNVFWDDA